MLRITWLLAFMCVSSAQDAFAEQVLVLKSGTARAYEDVARAFLDSLGGASVRVEQVPADGSELSIASDTSVVFCMGPVAAKYATVNLRHVPMVYALVPDGAALHAAGVSMRASPTDAMAALRRLYPSARSLGIVYTEAKLGSYLALVRDAASRAGFQLKAVTASSEADWSQALNEIGAVDLFWLLPDPRLVSRASITYVARSLGDRHIPLAVFSPELLSIGASASIAADLADTGRVAARLVGEVLAGKHPSEEVFPKCSEVQR